MGSYVRGEFAFRTPRSVGQTIEGNYNFGGFCWIGKRLSLSSIPTAGQMPFGTFSPFSCEPKNTSKNIGSMVGLETLPSWHALVVSYRKVHAAFDVDL